ncbi:MAG TPA: protein kinase, partial [Bryobacteraceae bacterium]
MISRIGKYTVEAELGRGGFGQVYKAWDPDVRQSVAIKVLLAEGDSDLTKRFQLEVVTTASLHHKNIVTIHASGVEGGTPYLVMELLEGQTLGQLIRNKTPLSLMEKVRIMTQVAEGLAYANSKGVVHRDVKPANIMLLPDGQVKIMDFGIALASNRLTATVTMDGFVVGTVPYMAPEQFNSDGKANEQTDIFAFGDVYYELLAGKHPFEPYMRDLSALRMAILNNDPQPLCQVLPECPEALELLVQRTLAKEREFRYQTFEELRLDSASVLVDLQHDQAAAILREVPRMLAAGEVQQARAKVREAQRLDPGNREARQLLESIDHKLQEKLSRERVAARLTDAEKQIADRRFAEAVQSLELAARMDTTNVMVQMRLADAKSRLERVLQANRLVEEARVRQQKGEWVEAADRLNRALEIDPEHTEANRLIPRINDQLGRRERDQTRQQAMRTASEHLSAKRYSEALAVLNELERRQAGGSGVAEMRSRIELERVEEERRVRAERFQLALSRTRETMQAGELDRAGRMLAHLYANFSGEPGAAEVLPLLRDRLNALLRTRDPAAAQRAGDPQNAAGRETSGFFTDAFRKAPDDSTTGRPGTTTNALFESPKRTEEIAAVRKRADSLRATGDLRGALAAIAEGRRRIGDAAPLVEMAREIEAEIERKRRAAGLRDLLDAVQELMASGLHADAIIRLTKAKDYSGEPEVLALLDRARTAAGAEEQQKFVAGALSTAANLRAEGDWKRAQNVLETGLAKYPHDQVLSQTLERLRDEGERERRSLAIEKHRSAILQEMEAGEWDKAGEAVRKAQLEFPDESMFDDLAEQVESGAREQSLHEAVTRVKAKLADNNLPEAIQQMEQTRPVFARDPRWKSLEEEVSRRRTYEEGLAEAERHRRQGNLPEAETLLTALEPGAPDVRATQKLNLVRELKSEAAAVAAKVRESLERYDIRGAAAELSAARAKYPDETGWNALQMEIDARDASLRHQAAIADSVRECLKRDDLREAAAKLAEGRARHQNEALWATLQAEIDTRRAFFNRQAEIGAAADGVRNALKRDDVTRAEVELEAARASYPDESIWADLRAQVDARQALAKRNSEIAAAAEGILECLNRNDLREAGLQLRSARKSFPNEARWAELQRQVDLYQANLSQRS